MTPAQNAPTVPAMALALAVEAAERRRRQVEWLAKRLAAYGHSPARKDGRELECGHAYCRHGCALCWMEAAEKAAEKAADAEPVPERRRGWNGQGRI